MRVLRLTLTTMEPEQLLTCSWFQATSARSQRKILDDPGSGHKPVIAGITINSKSMTPKMPTKTVRNVYLLLRYFKSRGQVREAGYELREEWEMAQELTALEPNQSCRSDIRPSRTKSLVAQRSDDRKARNTPLERWTIERWNRHKHAQELFMQIKDEKESLTQFRDSLARAIRLHSEDKMLSLNDIKGSIPRYDTRKPYTRSETATERKSDLLELPLDKNDASYEPLVEAIRKWQTEASYKPNLMSTSVIHPSIPMFHVSPVLLSASGPPSPANHPGRSDWSKDMGREGIPWP
nr:hypothetical protein HmN_000483500 [Hymenolepis microstoma]